MNARTVCALLSAVSVFWGYVTVVAFSRPLDWSVVMWLAGSAALVVCVVCTARWIDSARDVSYWTGRRDEARRDPRDV